MKILLLLLISAVTYGQTLTVAPAGSIVNDVLNLGVYAKQAELTGVTNQVAANQIDIAQLKAITPTVSMATNYTITNIDNGQILIFPNKCSIVYSDLLKMPFKCSVIQQGSTNYAPVQFIGTNVMGLNKKVKGQYGRVEVLGTATGICNISGDLKL